MIYFDNAATTNPKPPEVIKSVLEALKSKSVNPGRGGYDNAVELSGEIYRCRKKVSDFFKQTAYKHQKDRRL